MTVLDKSPYGCPLMLESTATDGGSGRQRALGVDSERGIVVQGVEVDGGEEGAGVGVR